MHVAIVGGSLAGLAAAVALNRLGILVSVFEKFPRGFEQRGSSLGFVDVPLWEHLRGIPMVRLGRRAHREQGAYYYGDLWKFLYNGLPEGCVKFGHTVTDLGDDEMHPTIDGKVYDVVIIADGGFSSLRRYVNGVEKQPEYAQQVIFRAKLEAKDYPGHFDGEGAYTEGKYFLIALNVALCDGRKFIMGGVGVGVPENEIAPPVAGANRHAEISEQTELPDWFMPLIRRTFAHHAGGQVLRWLELCASKGKITPQPLYEFMADQVVKGRILMIGDAAHMASPRTAAGAHTGILDAVGLLDAFSRHAGAENIDEAIRAYAPGGLQRAKDLYRRSKEVSRPLRYTAEDDTRRACA